MTQTHARWRAATPETLFGDLRPMTLLLRHITEVFDEPDTLRRLRAIKQIYLPNGGIAGADFAILGRHGPRGSGYAAFDAAAERLQAARPDHRFAVIECATVAGKIGCLKWRFASPNGGPSYTGVDIAICEQGRIKTLCSLQEDPASEVFDVEEICITLDRLSEEPRQSRFHSSRDSAPRQRVRRALGGGTPAASPRPPGRRPFVAIAVDTRPRSAARAGR